MTSMKEKRKLILKQIVTVNVNLPQIIQLISDYSDCIWPRYVSAANQYRVTFMKISSEEEESKLIDWMCKSYNFSLFEEKKINEYKNWAGETFVEMKDSLHTILKSFISITLKEGLEDIFRTELSVGTRPFAINTFYMGGGDILFVPMSDHDEIVNSSQIEERTRYDLPFLLLNIVDNQIKKSKRFREFLALVISNNLNVETLKYLRERGWDANERVSFGFSIERYLPIQWFLMIQEISKEQFEMLLQCGVDPNRISSLELLGCFTGTILSSLESRSLTEEKLKSLLSYGWKPIWNLNQIETKKKEEIQNLRKSWKFLDDLLEKDFASFT